MDIADAVQIASALAGYEELAIDTSQSETEKYYVEGMMIIPVIIIIITAGLTVITSW